MYIYTYMYIYICICIYVYIYINHPTNTYVVHSCIYNVGEIRVYSTIFTEKVTSDKSAVIGKFEIAADFFPSHMDCNDVVHQMAIVSTEGKVS